MRPLVSGTQPVAMTTVSLIQRQLQMTSEILDLLGVEYGELPGDPGQTPPGDSGRSGNYLEGGLASAEVSHGGKDRANPTWVRPAVPSDSLREPAFTRRLDGAWVALVRLLSQYLLLGRVAHPVAVQCVLAVTGGFLCVLRTQSCSNWSWTAQCSPGTWCQAIS